METGKAGHAGNSVSIKFMSAGGTSPAVQAIWKPGFMKEVQKNESTSSAALVQSQHKKI